MKKLPLILILLSGFFSFLQSQEPVLLKPFAPEGIFVNGREYIPLSSDQIRVELGYEGLFEEKLVFDLVVFNESGQSVSIEPASFYYLDLDHPQADSSSYSPKMSEHPEQLYKWYDRALEKQESDKSLNSFLGFMEAGLGILSSTAAFISTENPAYIVDAVFSTAGTAGHYMNVNRQIEESMEQTAVEQQHIRQEMLQETELEAGGVSNGFVCFPGKPESNYLLFCFPIENQEFQFVYQLMSDQ